MKIVGPPFEIHDYRDDLSVAEKLEACGRICYESEDQISDESALFW